MFANETYIQSTRGFVCIRVETYKHPETDRLISSMFRGKIPNSAFCLFDPTGTKRLCKPARSPYSLTGSSVGGDASKVAREMERIAAKYVAMVAPPPRLLQDFNSTAEAINIAAGDQRLLVILNSSEADLRSRLRQVIADSEVTGRFHVDQIKQGAADKWRRLLEKKRVEPGLLIVRPGYFGQHGEVMNVLGEGSSTAQIKIALLEANKRYSATEKRRDRVAHLAEGNRRGIKYDLKKPSNARTEILRGGGKRARNYNKGTPGGTDLENALDAALETSAKRKTTVLQVSGMT